LTERERERERAVHYKLDLLHIYHIQGIKTMHWTDLISLRGAVYYSPDVFRINRIALPCTNAPIWVIVRRGANRKYECLLGIVLIIRWIILLF
jgi:hypothetical protein